MSDNMKKFEAAIADAITKTLNETSYRPNYFMQMVSERGAYDASIGLIRASRPSDGFTKLWELERLDLTVEAVALSDDYSDIFAEDDLNKAERRLAQYNYVVGLPNE